MSSSSSSSATPLSSSWSSVVCVVCPTAVGLAVVVVTTGVAGRIGCLSLLLTKSPISSRLVPW